MGVAVTLPELSEWTLTASFSTRKPKIDILTLSDHNKV